MANVSSSTCLNLKISAIYLSSFLFLISCGGSTVGTEAELTTTEISEVSTQSVNGLMQALSNVNVDGNASATLKKLGSPLALSVDGANCNYSLTGINGMDMSQSGPAATFGPNSESITLTKEDYCAQNGDWTAFSFNKTYSVGVSCGSDAAAIFKQGEGVFRVNEGSTELYGKFKFFPGQGAFSYDLTCHFTFSDTGLDTSTCIIDEFDILYTETRRGCDLTQVTNVEIEAATPQENLYLFPTITTGPANFGGRYGADFACRVTAAADYSDLHCLHGVRSFVTVNATDEIQDMPVKYGVETDLPVLNAIDDATIASSWADLLDGNIDSPLSVNWWSGSTSVGAAADGIDLSCNEWTSNSGLALTGVAGQTDSFWIQDSDAGCSSQAYLMCLCF